MHLWFCSNFHFVSIYTDSVTIENCIFCFILWLQCHGNIVVFVQIAWTNDSFWLCTCEASIALSLTVQKLWLTGIFISSDLLSFIPPSFVYFVQGRDKEAINKAIETTTVGICPWRHQGVVARPGQCSIRCCYALRTDVCVEPQLCCWPPPYLLKESKKSSWTWTEVNFPTKQALLNRLVKWAHNTHLRSVVMSAYLTSVFVHFSFTVLGCKSVGVPSRWQRYRMETWQRSTRWFLVALCKRAEARLNKLGRLFRDTQSIKYLTVVLKSGRQCVGPSAVGDSERARVCVCGNHQQQNTNESTDWRVSSIQSI